jgi:anti-sigma B factor antagonist
MRAHAIRDGDLITLRLEGDLDVAAAPDLRAALDEALSLHPRRLVLDLAQVRFLDSTGLGVLLSRCRRLAERGGEMALARPQAPVARVLELSGALTVMPVVRGRAEEGGP